MRSNRRARRWSFSSAPPIFPAWGGGVVIHDVGPKLSLNAEVEHQLPRRVVNECTRESRCSSAAAAVAHRDWFIGLFVTKAGNGWARNTSHSSGRRLKLPEPASVFFGTGEIFPYLHVLGFVSIEKSNPKRFQDSSGAILRFHS